MRETERTLSLFMYICVYLHAHISIFQMVLCIMYAYINLINLAQDKASICVSSHVSYVDKKSGQFLSHYN
jgi:hypothetical protein